MTGRVYFIVGSKIISNKNETISREKETTLIHIRFDFSKRIFFNQIIVLDHYDSHVKSRGSGKALKSKNLNEKKIQM